MTTEQNQTNEVNEVEKPALPAIIALDVEDIRTGLAFAHDTARAQARLQAVFDAESTFATRLYAKYGIVPGQYELLDWLTGFQLVKKE